MTDDLIAIDDISDELPPAFMILDHESRQNITAMFSSDKTKILAIKQKDLSIQYIKQIIVLVIPSVH